jgi:hypothetical protein
VIGKVNAFEMHQMARGSFMHNDECGREVEVGDGSVQVKKSGVFSKCMICVNYFQTEGVINFLCIIYRDQYICTTLQPMVGHYLGNFIWYYSHTPPSNKYSSLVGGSLSNSLSHLVIEKMVRFVLAMISMELYFPLELKLLVCGFAG